MLEVQEELLKVANAKKDYTDLADRVEELRNEKKRYFLKWRKIRTNKAD